jgi:hypothetical protein
MLAKFFAVHPVQFHDGRLEFSDQFDLADLEI